ncbi:MAG: ribosome small subunit-dependent GTPase A [Firmicutes bacterium]|nr:ribosome small subunit-dependent GTPase A [Bacillota bacterium]
MQSSGVILKGIGGFYYVLAGDTVFECKARGIFRKEKRTPLAGDRVLLSAGSVPEQGVIDSILERKNSLIRPPVANLDRLFVVASSVEPSLNLLITDKLVAIAEDKGIEPVVVFTKTDLQSVTEAEQIYRSAGIRVLSVSPENPRTEELLSLLRGCQSAFTGNSGVGKSTLLNRLLPMLQQETGDISKKLGRGRHTTRQVELFAVPGGGFVADTPGFSSIDIERCETIRKEDLAFCFREFVPYLTKCKFSSCTHRCERGCAVLDAVQRGEIAASRHQSYCMMYDEVKDVKEWET